MKSREEVAVSRTILYICVVGMRMWPTERNGTVSETRCCDQYETVSLCPDATQRRQLAAGIPGTKLAGFAS